MEHASSTGGFIGEIPGRSPILTVEEAAAMWLSLKGSEAGRMTKKGLTPG